MLSALVLVPIALLSLWASPYTFLALVVAGVAIAAREWLGMCGLPSPNRAWLWFPAVIVTISVVSGLGRPGLGLSIGALGAVGSALWAPRPNEASLMPADRPVWTPWPFPARYDFPLGFVYLGVPAVALPWLRDDPQVGAANLLFILAIVWGSDIGAYLAGRLVGGPKLAPAISPGKTWSGAVGGLISGALGGLTVAACFSPEISPSHVIAPGIVLGIISQAGDLLESALKRHFGVKDSGHIIPGHGGLLDRLDALLAVAPVAALLAFTVGRGVVLWR